MAAQIRGIQPLAWGTVVMTGYVIEGVTDDEMTEQVLIDDEDGQIITEITDFGIKHDRTIEVIPKAATTAPAVGAIFTYGTKKMTILAISKKRIKKDVEKWTIKGNHIPGLEEHEA